MTLQSFLDDLFSGDDGPTVQTNQPNTSSSAVRDLLEQHVGGSGGTTPFETAAVPEDGGRLAVPAGSTTLNFSRGVAQNEDAGKVGEFRDLSDMGANVDSLTSCWLFADTTGKVQLAESNWYNIGPEQVAAFQTSGYQTIEVVFDQPATLYGAVSTRSKTALDVDAVTTSMSREGDLGAGTHDAYTPLLWSPHDLYADDGNQWGDATLYAGGFERSTLTVENTSAAANAVDVRVLAADTEAQDFREIASASGVAQGDHHIFHVTQAHRYLKAEATNSTDGNTVATKHSMTGGS